MKLALAFAVWLVGVCVSVAGEKKAIRESNLLAENVSLNDALERRLQEDEDEEDDDDEITFQLKMYWEVCQRMHIGYYSTDCPALICHYSLVAGRILLARGVV